MFLGSRRSPSKGAKRIGSEPVGKAEMPRKRVKMRDLEAVLRSGDTGIQSVEYLTSDQVDLHTFLSARDSHSQITFDAYKGTHSEIDAPLGRIAVEASAGAPNTQKVTNAGYKTSGITASSCITDINILACSKRDEKDHKYDVTKSSGLGLDLNVDVPNLLEQSIISSSHKSLDYVKAIEASECGSCVAPRDGKESESLKIWRAMKQNGFLSSSHGGKPTPKLTIPKLQGLSKRCKGDTFKRKLEIAKKEQMNRFSKVAAPSGLLSGLNPGIINHVRNSKQVFSIIEALVKSEKQIVCNSRRRENEVKEEDKATDGTTEDVVYEAENGQTCMERPIRLSTMYDHPNLKDEGDSSDAGEVSHYGSSFSLQYRSQQENERLKLKLSPTTGNLSSVFSDDISANRETVSSLSVKAARVASQWLELLQKDIRGRLSALKRSRKLFRSITERELPLLLPREFACQQENDLCLGECSKLSEVHMEHWRSVFHQMEKALFEEEKHLEISLKEVIEMQGHCDHGLQFVNASNGCGRFGMEKNSRLNQAEVFDRECAVRAAAASIYSTCNMVMRINYWM